MCCKPRKTTSTPLARKTWTCAVCCRAEGVKFLICRNSLVGRSIDPADLYDVKTGDIVGAAVAEVAALQAQGFVYLKP